MRSARRWGRWGSPGCTTAWIRPGSDSGAVTQVLARPPGRRRRRPMVGDAHPLRRRRPGRTVPPPPMTWPARRGLRGFHRALPDLRVAVRDGEIDATRALVARTSVMLTSGGSSPTSTRTCPSTCCRRRGPCQAAQGTPAGDPFRARQALARGSGSSRSRSPTGRTPRPGSPISRRRRTPSRSRPAGAPERNFHPPGRPRRRPDRSAARPRPAEAPGVAICAGPAHRRRVAGVGASAPDDLLASARPIRLRLTLFS